MIIRKYKEKCQVEKLNIQVKWTNSLKDTNAQQTNSRKNYLNVITSIKLNLLFKNLTKKKENPCPDDFSGKLYQTLNEQIVPIPHKTFQKIDIEEYFSKT